MLVHARFAGLVVVVLLAFAVGDPIVRSSVVVMASATVAVNIGLRLIRGQLTWVTPWWFMVIGVSFLTANNLSWLIEVGIAGATAQTAWVPLVTLPLGYLGFLCASVLLVLPAVRRDAGGVLDAATIAVGAAVVLWTVLMFPALDAAGATPLERSYDLMVLLILSGVAGALVQAITTAVVARPSLGYFLISMVVTLAGTILSAVAADPVTGAAPRWVGALWGLGYFAASAAASHPSSAQLDARGGEGTGGQLSAGRLSLLGVALVVGPVFAAGQELMGHDADWLMLSLALLVLVPLVLARVAQLARSQARAEKRLERLADHDQLTGLPNRRAADRHLTALLDRVNNARSPGAAVLYLDLDGFKVVNDTLGHRVGDDLLVVVADRLRRCVRNAHGDIVARFGGDEFVVVLEGDDERLAIDAASRIEAAFAEPVQVGEHALQVRVSIGIASARPGGGATLDTLLSLADDRMYQHKRERRAAWP
ncbi:diguanylate cyclase [Pengzhenrongella frigida]|nr:diguanylate cyclase [Cellulomonas sp. HLT2-17]